MIMPMLRRHFNPPFQYVEDIVVFVRQSLEGLVFLHENGIAHRSVFCLRV